MIKCYNVFHFWKLEFNRYMIFYCRKSPLRARATHARNENVIYNGGNFKQNVGNKIYRKLLTLFTTMICLFSDLMLSSLLADILNGHRRMLMSREMKYFQKCDFLRFFYTFYYNLGRFMSTMCAY